MTPGRGLCCQRCRRIHTSPREEEQPSPRGAPGLPAPLSTAPEPPGCWGGDGGLGVGTVGSAHGHTNLKKRFWGEPQWGVPMDLGQEVPGRPTGW